MLTEVSPVLAKALSPIVTGRLGSIKEVSSVILAKALSPIVSAVLFSPANVTLARSLFSKAFTPIKVTVAGISISSITAFENADAPMETVPPRFTVARLGSCMSWTESYASISAKALSPMVTGRSGRVSSEIAIPSKALSPIVRGAVPPFSNVTVAREPE